MEAENDVPKESRLQSFFQVPSYFRGYKFVLLVLSSIIIMRHGSRHIHVEEVPE